MSIPSRGTAAATRNASHAQVPLRAGAAASSSAAAIRGTRCSVAAKVAGRRGTYFSAPPPRSVPAGVVPVPANSSGPATACLLRQWFAAADASDDRPIGGHIRHLDLPQELHGPQVLDQRPRRPGSTVIQVVVPSSTRWSSCSTCPCGSRIRPAGDARREVVEFGRGEAFNQSSRSGPTIVTTPR